METVCGFMRIGKNAHRLATYLPNEDMMMRDELPDDQKTPGADLCWEMRYVTPPKKLSGYSSIWISGETLPRIQVENGNLCCGDMSVPALHIDVEWLDRDALTELLRIVKAGGKIILKGDPKQPGYQPSEGYAAQLDELKKHPNTLQEVNQVDVAPIVEGDDLPPFWCRENDGELYLFFAHPYSAEVKYPMQYCQYQEAKAEERKVKVNFAGQSFDLDLFFAPGDSILLRIAADGSVEKIYK